MSFYFCADFFRCTVKKSYLFHSRRFLFSLFPTNIEMKYGNIEISFVDDYELSKFEQLQYIALGKSNNLQSDNSVQFIMKRVNTKQAKASL